MFEKYETILSRELISGNVTGNQIEQDQTKRRTQIKSLLAKGLETTASLDKVESDLGDAINIAFPPSKRLLTWVSRLSL